MDSIKLQYPIPTVPHVRDFGILGLVVFDDDAVEGVRVLCEQPRRAHVHLNYFNKINYNNQINKLV